MGKRLMKTIGIVSLCYGIYAITSTYGYTLYQMNQAQKRVESKNVKTLEELSQTVPMNESVAMTSKLEDGLVLRGELIDQAETSLSIAQYKISNDESGLYIVKKLEDAAKRGVDIQILVNGLSSAKRGPSYLSLLDSYENVQLKVVGGIDLIKPWKMNNVLHDKLILVDDAYLLSSGRNISNRFMLPSSSEGVTEDMDIVIKRDGPPTENSLISQGQSYYNELWKADYAKKKNDYSQSKQLEKRRKELEEMNEQTEKEYAYLLNESPLQKMTFSPVDNGCLVFNETNSIVKEPIVWKQVTTLINQAKDEVNLMSPYVVITNKMFSYMEPNEKKKLNIYTNSGSSSPNVLAFGGYLKQKNRLLDRADIWEFQSKNSIHQKAIAVDDKVIGVGSFNTDSRSTFLSSENMVFINSPMASQELDHIIKDYESKSLKVDSLLGYQEDKKGIEEPMKTSKKIALKIIGFFSPLFRIFL